MIDLDTLLVILITFSIFGAWGLIFWTVAVPRIKRAIDRMMDRLDKGE